MFVRLPRNSVVSPNLPTRCLPQAGLYGRDRCLDYGPMFTQLHGRKWVLVPGAVEIRNDSALCNIFEAENRIIVPIVLGRCGSVEARIRSRLFHSTDVLLEIWYPGAEEPVRSHRTIHGEHLMITAPLRRGCAFVVITPE